MISFKRFWSIFIARNKEFYRDKGALGWTLLFPLLMVFAFGYFIDIGGQGQYKIGGIEKPSQEIHKLLEWVPFKEKKQGLEKLRNFKIDLFWDHEEQKLYTNQASPQSEVALSLYNRDENIQRPYQLAPIKGKVIKYVDWLFPGLIAFNVLWMALWGVGWVVVRQRKLGVLKRLKISPLSAFEYLLAQVASRMLVLWITGIIVMVGSSLIYPLTMQGSYFDLFIVYTVSCFALSSIGLIIAARISSEEFANGVLNLITYPLMILSEVFYSMEGATPWIKGLMHYLPLWQMADSMRQIMLEGVPLGELQGRMFSMLVLGLTFTFIGAYFFKWNPEDR